MLPLRLSDGCSSVVWTRLPFACNSVPRATRLPTLTARYSVHASIVDYMRQVTNRSRTVTHTTSTWTWTSTPFFLCRPSPPAGLGSSSTPVAVLFLLDAAVLTWFCSRAHPAWCRRTLHRMGPDASSPSFRTISLRVSSTVRRRGSSDRPRHCHVLALGASAWRV